MTYRCESAIDLQKYVANVYRQDYGSSRIRCFCLDPDPVFKFIWSRIRIQFQHPDPEFPIKIIIK